MAISNMSLKRQLRSIQRGFRLAASRFERTTGEVTAAQADKGQDLILSPNELNHHHGTGVLLNRIFSPATSLNIRSREDYQDKGDFTSLVIKAQGRTRAEVFAMCMEAMAGHSIRRIFCVPYYPEDFVIAIACKSILGVPLVVWLMDDVIIHNSGFHSELAAELFNLADIRFVISPEMRDAYESKYQIKFHILPPTVNAQSLRNVPFADFSVNMEAKTCAMVGNIWGKIWLRDFLGMVRNSGWTIHWFGRGSACSWLEITSEELREHGIIEMGFIPEKELPARLAAYPFAILPTGTGGEGDDRKNVTLLSLPTRMPFLMAAARIPLLVVGSPASCAARFIKRFGVGLSSPYEPLQFVASLKKLVEPSFNNECRANCAANAGRFSDENLVAWIWNSCEKQVPAYDRFEVMFRRELGEMVPYVEEPSPKELYGDFKLVHSSIRRIARLGYAPDFVIDVGGSSGVWSDAVHLIFPKARFVLIEPLPERYSQWCHKLHPEFEWVTAAASNKDGKATFQISNDLYGSSLFTPEDNRIYQSVEVPVVSLDTVLAQKRLKGRGMVKIDVQFAEHLVIEGAEKLLGQVDFLIIELTLRRCVPEARTLLEMVNQLEAAGFLYYDDIGGWRCPVTGVLEQKDVVFVNISIAERFQGMTKISS
jgi:FkbM family methyltransferase